jgi:hypothetical protein
MGWVVEVLEAALPEIEALPADMQARFRASLNSSNLKVSSGFENRTSSTWRANYGK